MHKQTHGGARTGAGRKPGTHGAKQTLTLRLSPIILDFLDTLEITRADFIERNIMKSNEFRLWKKTSEKISDLS